MLHNLFYAVNMQALESKVLKNNAMNKIYIVVILLMNIQTIYSQKITNYILVYNGGTVDTVFTKNKSKINNEIDSHLTLNKYKANTKESNVVFIYYTNKKLPHYVYYGKEKISFGSYIFKFINNYGHNDNVYLIHNKYKNFDNQYKDIKMLNFKVNKSFLRKNKDIILTEEKIKKMGRENFISLLSIVDMVFLIDKNMIQNNKITIMEMNFDFNTEE